MSRSAPAVRPPAELIGRRVRVYLDSTRRLWSLVVNRKVVGKADSLVLTDCTFVVSQTARLRVIRTKRKTPHAYVEGVLTARLPAPSRRKFHQFRYSPHDGYPTGRFRSAGRALVAAKKAILIAFRGGVICRAWQPIFEDDP